MTASVGVQDLSVTFTTPDSESMAALGPVAFEIEAGTFVCLVGPSGCGKSTLIRVIAGLQPATAGWVWIGDETITRPSARVALMFQDANLMPWRTVIDNVALPLELAGVNKQTRHDAARSLLDMLQLDAFATAYPGELSGGMAQRAALGRVLIRQPDVLLLDEPLGALDALTREKVSLDLLRAWAHQRQTVLMVTHDIREAVFMADRVLVMSHRPGQIIADILIDLPRPRTLEDTFDEPFVRLTKQVRAAIDRA